MYWEDENEMKNNKTKQINSECSSAMKQCDYPLRWLFYDPLCGSP